MAATLGDLVSGDELRTVSVLRAKRFDEKTVTAASAKSLQMKREAEEHDGWELAKENKRSLRMRRLKPEDRQLEDDVWTLFYRMGFKEMNADRNLMVIGKDGATRRQLDVFAKDDETVFIVECTHSRDWRGPAAEAAGGSEGPQNGTSSSRSVSPPALPEPPLWRGRLRNWTSSAMISQP